MIELRPATADDGDLLLAWRSEPSTVAASFTAAAPRAEEHRSWLAAVLADPDRQLWIVEAGGEPVGQVRLDRAEGGAAEISVSIAEAARGRRLAAAAIVAACQRSGGAVVARIRPGNGASIAAFTAAGFVPAPPEDGGGTVVLRWQPPPVSGPTR